ncbi:hypothetical protein PIROE2DRAFT_69430 [Piromyces sp. E2]|nr:hypothetical protein PIROE2DRAFT_69430 [Piromyces sp. E2]|eukprot:OUM62972.1 hypothetical protein PIROE2DRAFT_69430 [Piromyces sp. E2]
MKVLQVETQESLKKLQLENEETKNSIETYINKELLPNQESIRQETINLINKNDIKNKEILGAVVNKQDKINQQIEAQFNNIFNENKEANKALMKLNKKTEEYATVEELDKITKEFYQKINKIRVKQLGTQEFTTIYTTYRDAQVKKTMELEQATNKKQYELVSQLGTQLNGITTALQGFEEAIVNNQSSLGVIVADAIQEAVIRITTNLKDTMPYVPDPSLGLQNQQFLLYLGLLMTAPKAIAYFNCIIDENGNITSISPKREFKEKVNKLIKRRYLKYYETDKLKELLSKGTAGMLDLSLSYLELSDNSSCRIKTKGKLIVSPRPKGKEPEGTLLTRNISQKRNSSTVYKREEPSSSKPKIRPVPKTVPISIASLFETEPSDSEDSEIETDQFPHDSDSNSDSSSDSNPDSSSSDASTSSTSDSSSSSDSDDSDDSDSELTRLTKANTDSNRAESAKFFKNRHEYRLQYKIPSVIPSVNHKLKKELRREKRRKEKSIS